MDKVGLQPVKYFAPFGFLTPCFAITTMRSMEECVIQSIPKEPGSYILWLHLPRSRNLTVGRLGRFDFPRGDYVYLGSALGPGGLRSRLGRHLDGKGQPHWHIDRLRSVAIVQGFAYQTSTMRTQRALHLIATECIWSQTLAALPEAIIPAPGFGASDCRSGCAAHLVNFSINIHPILERFARQTGIHFKTIKKIVS